LYPFRVRITDPDIQKKLKLLNKNRYIPSDKKLSIWIGVNLKPIRKDIFIGTDNTKGNPGIALKDIGIILKFKPAYGRRKGLDVVFNKLL